VLRCCEIESDFLAKMIECTTDRPTRTDLLDRGEEGGDESFVVREVRALEGRAVKLFRR